MGMHHTGDTTLEVLFQRHYITIIFQCDMPFLKVALHFRIIDIEAQKVLYPASNLFEVAMYLLEAVAGIFLYRTMGVDASVNSLP